MFSPGCNDKRVTETLIHYESQTEDEAAFEVVDLAAMEIPPEPAIKAP